MKNLEINEIINPKKSIFVSANAGSGKTFILVARVLGLLVAGEDPLKILCISFTDAAAGEMKTRIIKKLKEWHKDGVESEEILKTASQEEKERARNLYKDVVLLGKMPKIQTFHSFCMQVLRAFSAESGFAYKPTTLSKSRENSIKNQIFKNLISDVETRELLKEMRFAFSSFEVRQKIIPAILNERENSVFKEEDFERKAYNLLNLEYAPNLSEKWEKDFIENFPFDELEILLDGVKNVGIKKNMNLRIKALEDFLNSKLTNLLETAFLNSTKDDFLKSTPFKKAIELEDIWLKIKNYYEEKREIQGRILTAKLTENLMKLVKKILTHYEEEKKRLEAVDFDDLILLTQQALSGEERDFILFKLDGGINHILVDEAQDTNFLQWEILGFILEEFFAGNGSERGARSLFIVGDEKQSIFSFQNAKPEALYSIFLKYRKHLNQVYLQKSYRTSQILLDFIDSIFSKKPYKSMVSHQEYQKHFASKDGFGRIEIITPAIYQKTKKNIDKTCFIMPWEERDDGGLKKMNAVLICQKIISILKERRLIESKGRAVKPCDFMLLFAYRDYAFFSLIKEELSKHQIGVSFSDEIPLDESFVISDFIHLLRYLLNQKNTFSLQVVLNSNMFHGSFSSEDDVLPLKNLLNKDIFHFFSSIFAKFGERYKNEEVRHIAHLFNIIEEYEQTSHSPNFEGFLMFYEELVRQGETFKINLESEENAVIFSTVHSSKGLESPIVFLLNVNKTLSREDNKENLLFCKENNLFLLSKKKLLCKKWKEIKDKNKDDKYTEYIRLFYVALTRAREEIYIFAEKIEEDVEYKSWYNIAKEHLLGERIVAGELKIGEDLPEKKSKESIFVQPMAFSSSTQKRERATEKAKENKALILGTALHDMLANEGRTSVDMTKEEREQLFILAEKVKAKFTFLFEKSTFTEIEIMQEGSNGTLFSGRIDRLIIGKDIEIYDFKFQKIPFLLEKTKFQLAKYKEALAKIYPNKEIKCFAVWVKELEIEEISDFFAQTGERRPQLF
jgi:ATP-dependent helicase/nuclease subunit A